jgi:hypothetical protein
MFIVYCLWFVIPMHGLKIPADVGVITNHQRQGKWCFFRVECLGFRCADLGLEI